MDNLASKTIIVTGASSGIGRATAQLLIEQGANVIMLVRNMNVLRDMQAGMPQDKAMALYADLLEPEKLQPVMEEAWNWRGQVDGLVHCAGLGGYIRLRDTDPDFMMQRMKVNCISFVEMVRRMVKKKKKIQPFSAVAISSLASSGHYKYFVAYAASKAALEAAAKAMSAELATRNVAINVIQPGFVDTPFISSLKNVTDMQGSKQQPLGLIQPGEVARMVLFLLSGECPSVTGSVFSISGGSPC